MSYYIASSEACLDVFLRRERISKFIKGDARERGDKGYAKW